MFSLFLEDKVESPSNPFLSQFLPTFVLWLFTAILPSIVSWSSYYEYQWTRYVKVCQNNQCLGDMENNRIFKTTKKQWNFLVTGKWLDEMESSGIFKSVKRQWNIPITGTWLDSSAIVVLCNWFFRSLPVIHFKSSFPNNL